MLRAIQFNVAFFLFALINPGSAIAAPAYQAFLDDAHERSAALGLYQEADWYAPTGGNSNWTYLKSKWQSHGGGFSLKNYASEAVLHIRTMDYGCQPVKAKVKTPRKIWKEVCEDGTWLRRGADGTLYDFAFGGGAASIVESEVRGKPAPREVFRTFQRFNRKAADAKFGKYWENAWHRASESSPMRNLKKHYQKHVVDELGPRYMNKITLKRYSQDAVDLFHNSDCRRSPTYITSLGETGIRVQCYFWRTIADHPNGGVSWMGRGGIYRNNGEVITFWYNQEAEYMAGFPRRLYTSALVRF